MADVLFLRNLEGSQDESRSTVCLLRFYVRGHFGRKGLSVGRATNGELAIHVLQKLEKKL